MPSDGPGAARLVLEGAAIEERMDATVALLEHACLNRFFPDVSGMRNLLTALRPSRNGGLYPRLVLDPATGLPAEPEVSRVLADHVLARAETSSPGAVSLRGDSSSRIGLRRLYYQGLVEAPPPLPVSLELTLRRVDPDRRTASFVVTFDRFDLAKSVFVRYTISLLQASSRWSRSQVELRGDDLACTDNFRHAVARFAADEAEIAFLLLAELPGVTVEEVRRCRVGPLYFPGVRMPDDFAEVAARHPHDLILHLPCDRAALDLMQDGCSDPLSMSYRDFLEGEARAVVQERARTLGYRVWKERKFCCTAGVAADLKALLGGRGVPALVRVVSAVPARRVG